MIDRRRDCLDENPGVEQISENGWRVGEANIDLVNKLVADMERVDRESIDLLHERKWTTTPEKVLRAILGELGHPRPDNVTR